MRQRCFFFLLRTSPRNVETREVAILPDRRHYPLQTRSQGKRITCTRPASHMLPLPRHHQPHQPHGQAPPSVPITSHGSFLACKRHFTITLWARQWNSWVIQPSALQGELCRFKTLGTSATTCSNSPCTTAVQYTHAFSWNTLTCIANSVRDISKGAGCPLTSRWIMVIATALRVPTP